MFCEKCGSELPPRAKFCVECGAPVTQAPPEPEPFDPEDTILPEPEPFEPGPGPEPEPEPAPEPASAASSDFVYYEQPAPEARPSAPLVAEPAEPTFSSWRQQTSSSVPAQEPVTPAAQTPGEQPWQAPYYQSVQTPRASSQPSAPAAPRQESFSPASGGWSIPGSGASEPSPAGGPPPYTPARAPAAAERKPLYTRWWFWLIIVLAVLIVIAAIGAYFVTRVLNAYTGGEPLVSGSIGSVVTRAAEAVPESGDIDIPGIDVPNIDIPGVDIPEAPDDAETPDKTDISDETDMPGLEEEIEREIESALPDGEPHPAAQAVADALLPELALTPHEYEIEVDSDGWITVYLWHEGLDELSDDAYAGDEEAIAQWEDELEVICSLSERIYRDLAEAGLPDAGALVFLQDDVYEDVLLAGAADGTLIYDWVNDLDVFGLENESY